MGRGQAQPVEEPDDFLPSPQLPVARGVVRRRGRRGARKGQVQLGTGIVQLVAGAQAPALALELAPFQSQH